jgi:hypothetical protein
VIYNILKLIGQFVIAFRILETPEMRAICLATIGKVLDRHDVPVLFKVAWRETLASVCGIIEQEGVIAYAACVDGWTDKRNRPFVAARSRAMSRDFNVRSLFLGMKMVNAPREDGPAIAELLWSLLSRLPDVARTAQLLTDGASVMGVVKRTIRTQIRLAVVPEGAGPDDVGMIASACYSHKYQLAIREYWHKVPALGPIDGQPEAGQGRFLSELTNVRRLFENTIVNNYLEQKGGKVHMRVPCITRWSGVGTSANDLVQLIPLYQGFLDENSLRDAPCADVARSICVRLA